jgi:hypothetical protein
VFSALLLPETTLLGPLVVGVSVTDFLLFV